mmetsp:Transcript_34870/g.109854  ORF Transcript_34870/g.109854 Transcript_34870/m.109854 type:complete len:126 (-) Transcript_34870:309-686(-)
MDASMHEYDMDSSVHADPLGSIPEDHDFDLCELLLGRMSLVFEDLNAGGSGWIAASALEARLRDDTELHGIVSTADGGAEAVSSFLQSLLHEPARQISLAGLNEELQHLLQPCAGVGADAAEAGG